MMLSLPRCRCLFLIFLLGALPAHAAITVQAWTQADGARVLFVESRSVPIVDISLAFDAGTRRDPAHKAGLAALTNALLASGVRAATDSAALNEAQISDTFADVGAQRSEEVASDRAGLSLRTLSSREERAPAIRLLARIAAQPAFPDDAFARDQARSIAALREELTKPEALAQRALMRLMYAGHPYGIQDTPETIAAITRDDVERFHRQHYVANHAVIAIIGDLDRAEAEAIARALTQDLPQGAALAVLPETPPPRAAEERIAHPATQAHILLGAPAIARGDADHFPLLVGNYILGGGGFASRLMQEVREKRGLAYDVSSVFSPLAQKGPFEIALQTQKEQAGAALALVRKTLADFLRDGPGAKELQAARANLAGGFALRIDSNRKILDNIAAIGFYHLPNDYLATWTARVLAVTADDVRAAFRRKLSAESLVTVVTGDAP